jgi:hypothetical protein
MATNGTIIQYAFTNNSFSNYLETTPNVSAPYPGLPTLLCYDAGTRGYALNITPHSSNNQINVQFKVKYAASNVAFTKLTVGIVYTTNGGASYNIVGQDSFSGSVNAGGPVFDVYLFNYIHSPNTTNNVVYKMFFQLETNSSIPIGLIGDANSSNCIILEEFTLI